MTKSLWFDQKLKKNVKENYSSVFLLRPAIPKTAII